MGKREFDVGRPQFDAAPPDGIARVYLLPGTDRIVNIKRISDAPTTPAGQQGRARVQEMLGAVPDDGRVPHTAASVAELRSALTGRWEGTGRVPLHFEFRADGTAFTGSAKSERESQRWEAVAADRIRIDGDEQQVAIEGDMLSLSTRGMSFRLLRVR